MAGQFGKYSVLSGSGGGGGGLTDINGAVGPSITLAAGTGISVGTVGNTITISNTESAFTPGNLTDVGTDGIVITGGTNAVNGAGTSIAQHVSDTTHNGYLSSTDWNTFNSKFTLPSLTAGSILFSDGTTIAQDNANFSWNDAANRFAVNGMFIENGNEFFASSDNPINGGQPGSFIFQNSLGGNGGISSTGAGTAAFIDIIGSIGFAGLGNSASNLSLLSIDGNINRTAGSTGTTRGLNVVPVEISTNNAGVANYIAFFGKNVSSTEYIGYGVRSLVGTGMQHEFTGNVGIGTTTPGYLLDVVGDIASDNVGSGFRVKEGSNAKMGTAVLNGGTPVVVATTAVTANSRIFLTQQVAGGTQSGISFVTTRTPGTSFTINSVALDTSTVAWIIFEPS